MGTVQRESHQAVEACAGSGQYLRRRPKGGLRVGGSAMDRLFVSKPQIVLRPDAGARRRPSAERNGIALPVRLSRIRALERGPGYRSGTQSFYVMVSGANNDLIPQDQYSHRRIRENWRWSGCQEATEWITLATEWRCEE